MAKKTKLPFSMMPASWGLKGKSRARAEAEYYYEGDELEKVLAGIDVNSDEEKSVAEIEIDVKNGKLSQSEADKKIANIKKEPWVNVNKMGVDPENAKAGFIELDWNDEFVSMLQDNGYVGTTDEQTVNTWFNDVCRTVLIQEKADQDYGLQEGRNDVVTTRQDRDQDED